MVENPVVTATLIAICILVLAAFAESMHRKRVNRIARLVFGANESPARWAKGEPYIRSLALAGCSWGLMILLLVPATVTEVEPDPEASKHLLICLDASPSMFLEDAGRQFAGKEQDQQRMVRAGEVMRAVLDRIDGEKTRVTVFGVYTRAVPIIEETFDKSVVNNLFDGLPIFAAFEQGPTALSSSVSQAIEYSRKWQDDSTLLLVVSDGDSTDASPIRAIPKAIAETLVIGVGKTNAATNIAGHASRQDADSLRRLAKQLRGTYFDANQQHLPSELLDRLAVVQPRVGDSVRLRDAALILFLISGMILATLLPALCFAGLPSKNEETVAVMGLQRGGGVS